MRTGIPDPLPQEALGAWSGAVGPDGSVVWEMGDLLVLDAAKVRPPPAGRRTGAEVVEWLADVGVPRALCEAMRAAIRRHDLHSFPIPRGPTRADGLGERVLDYALADCAGDIFVDQVGTPMALVNGRAISLLSGRAESWIRRVVYDREGRTVPSEAVSVATRTLAARAEGSGACRHVFLRFARHAGRLYVEHGRGRVYEVGPGHHGWCDTPPVVFRDLANLRDLPAPAGGGQLADILPFVNLGPDERNQRLFIAHLALAPFEDIARPWLMVTGRPGAAKSSTTALYKRMWDPTAPPTVRLIREEDVLQKADHAAILVVDNAAQWPKWAPACVCRLVTGEGDSKRRLYSDDEDVIYELRRQVVVNGLSPPADDGDLMDRCLLIEQPPISKTSRRREADLDVAFRTAHPRLLGALYDVIAEAMTRHPAVADGARVRLADWAGWALAVYAACGWTPQAFERDWAGAERAQHQAALDGSHVAQVVVAFMAGRSNNTWDGLSSTLLDELNTTAQGLKLPVQHLRDWPQSPSWLYRRIRPIEPLLEARGFIVTRHEENDGSHIRIGRASPPPHGSQDAATAPLLPPASRGDQAAEPAADAATAASPSSETETNGSSGSTASGAAIPTPQEGGGRSGSSGRTSSLVETKEKRKMIVRLRRDIDGVLCLDGRVRSGRRGELFDVDAETARLLLAREAAEEIILPRRPVGEVAR